MSKKIAATLAVEVDEVGLSVLGWEVADVQARLTWEKYDTYFYGVAAAMELRFHPDDWQVRHGGTNEHLPNVVWQLRPRAKGALSSYQCITLAVREKEVRAPKLLSNKMDQWESKAALDTGDLYIWLGGFDWTETDGWHTEPAVNWTDVPVEVFDHTSFRGVRTSIVEQSARIRDGEELEVNLRAVHPLGSPSELVAAAADYSEWAIDGDLADEEQADYEVPGPQIIIDVFDSTGFLLERREPQHGRLTVPESGVIPTRPPTSLTMVTFDLDDMSDKPARVVVRLQDAVE